MALIRKAVQAVGPAGLAATYFADLTTTDTFLIRNNGSVMLHFKKTGIGACTVTIDTPGNVDGLAIPNRTVTVPATTGDIHIAKLSPSIYNDVNGDLRITLSDVAGLTLAVMDNG